MSIANKPITAKYKSRMKLTVLDATGNQIFSATAVETATASAYDIPSALGIAAKLATESVYKRGPELVSLYLATLNTGKTPPNSNTLNKDDTCSVTGCYQHQFYYMVDGNTFPTFSIQICAVSNSLRKCLCCTANMTSEYYSECKSALDYLPSGALCVNTGCGCPSQCTC